MGIQRQNSHHNRSAFQQIAITYNVRLRGLWIPIWCPISGSCHMAGRSSHSRIWSNVLMKSSSTFTARLLVKGSLPSAAEEFVNAPIGNYFYLTHGNQGVYLLGQFTGPVNYFTKHSDGWMDRPFRLIHKANAREAYYGIEKWWHLITTLPLLRFRTTNMLYLKNWYWRPISILT